MLPSTAPVIKLLNSKEYIMNNTHSTNFTFNSSGSFDFNENFKIYYDSHGNIRGDSQRLFGNYNFPINISIKKLLMINVSKIGLGDIIDFFTKKLYIKNFIMFLTKGNCGCEERRIFFNKWIKIPYKISFSSRKLFEDDSDLLYEFKKMKKNKVKIKQIKTHYDSTMELFDSKKKEYEDFFEKQKGIFKSMSTDHKNNFKTPVNDSNKVKPVDPKQIKGGCGCGKK